MSKRVEQIKNQLMQLAEAINAFRSEAVQTRVVDWVINVLTQDKTDNPAPSIPKAKPNKPGATKILNQMLLTVFSIPHIQLPKLLIMEIISLTLISKLPKYLAFYYSSSKNNV